VLIIWFGGYFSVWALVTLVGLLGLYEFYQLAAMRQVEVMAGLGLVSGVGLNFLLLRGMAWWLAGWGLLLPFCAGLALVFGQGRRRHLPGMAVTLFGVWYTVFLLDYALLLYLLPQGKRWLLFWLLLVWTYDSCAYYAGRSFGRHKLSPRISPKKTVEGALGGLAACGLAAWVGGGVLGLRLGAGEALFLGVSVGVVAQVGDLVESQLKRWAGVKDSGYLFPGHGGVLDRIDGLLFSAPLLYCWARF